ncbi:hypothetical protein SUGI_1503700 [Cryptomeria japonica]|uniref:Uncharacterized protein n=1 Tax=Cryptomeria japonica TaxID=3369 RepID=A0AAD3NUI3_CRYJA|nr:hypothetical protein SUGI_1500510 [Cryptomeria japonica]GLJ59342.1 hypothetical protein SUGI_1503700 [Cryptomeria japonica]
MLRLEYAGYYSPSSFSLPASLIRRDVSQHYSSFSPDELVPPGGSGWRWNRINKDGWLGWRLSSNSGARCLGLGLPSNKKVRPVGPDASTRIDLLRWNLVIDPTSLLTWAGGSETKIYRDLTTGNNLTTGRESLKSILRNAGPGAGGKVMFFSVGSNPG